MSAESFTKPKTITAFAIVSILIFSLNLAATVFVFFFSDDYQYDDTFTPILSIGIAIIALFFAIKSLLAKTHAHVKRQHASLITVIALLFMLAFADRYFKLNIGFNIFPFLVQMLIFSCFPSFRKFNKSILESDQNDNDSQQQPNDNKPNH